MLQVRSVDGLRGVHQAFCNEPCLERVWVLEFLGPVLEVDGVDEGLDEPDVAGSGLTVGHRLQYIHNPHESNIGYNNLHTEIVSYGRSRMYPYMNEDVAFERLKDLQREMENSRAMTGALAELCNSVRILALRAWWLAMRRPPRRRPVQVQHEYEEQSASDAA